MAKQNGSKPLRVAISGLGWVATTRYVPCFKRVGAEVVGGYTPSGKGAEGHLKVVNNFEDLLGLGPDIVAICSPPWAHAEQTVKALSHGCHVLVEKPMAMRAEEARNMAEAARDHHRLLCVAHSHLFDRSLIEAAEYVKSGKLGQLVSVQALFFRGGLRPGKEWLFELPGGLVFDELPHPVYLLQQFIGPAKLSSVDVESVPGRRTPRQVHVVLRGERGTGQIAIVTDAPVSEWHLVVTGTKRMLIVDLFRDVLVSLPSDGAHTPLKVLNTSLVGLSTHVMGLIASGIRYTAGRAYYGHDILIERFAAAVRTGSALPVGVEEALRTQELVDQIIQPASTQ